MAIERGIDCFRHKKSDHLTGDEVGAICNEKGSCVVVIEDTYYNSEEVIHGKKTPAYILSFTDKTIKKMAVTSVINKKQISKLVQQSKGLSESDARNIDNWIGLKMSMYFDAKVTMGKETKGGIRIHDTLFIKPPLELLSTNYDNCVKALKSGSYTIEQIEAKYTLSQEVKTKLLEDGKTV